MQAEVEVSKKAREAKKVEGDVRAPGFVSHADIEVLKGRHPVTGSSVEVEMAPHVLVGDDVPAELRRMPKRFAFFLGLLEVARDDLRAAQHEEYCTEEDIYVALLRDGEKTKVTDLRTMVKVSPKMREAYRRRMEAESRFKHAEAAVRMMEEKQRSLAMWVKYTTTEMSVHAGSQED